MEEHQISDDLIFSKVKELLSRLEKNKKLQELAENNGLNVKNSVNLTDETIDNVAISVVSLLLAERANDPRYKSIVRMGLDKRTLKTELINDYKNEARMLIDKCNQNELSSPFSVDQ